MAGFLKRFGAFLQNDHNLPLIAGIASGLYPWVFYFSNNYKFVNSWEHFFFFLTRFVLLPMAVYYILYFLLRKKHLDFYKQRILPTLSSGVFLLLSMIALFATIGWKKKVALVVAVVFVFFVTKKVKDLLPKIIVIQFLLVLTTVFSVAEVVKKYVTYDHSWISQSDAITETQFSKTPNVYVIQPDGYVNFSEINRGYYNFDNSTFKDWLMANNFTIYEDFRSNYHSTLTSNSSLFGMQHHYYNVVDERKAILDDNPVVRIFNQNGYTTHFLAEVPYLQTNRPDIAFDYTSFDDNTLPYLSKGLDTKRLISEDFPPLLQQQNGANFYFLEKLLPSHIATFKSDQTTKDNERSKYLNRLQDANTWLQDIVQQIERVDPNALIIIAADHGGFVGWEYTMQTKNKTDDADKIKSIFSTLLAVKWPDNNPPEFHQELKTSVNLFRIVFAYLSDNPKLLEQLQPNRSYIKLSENGLYNVYEYIDENGTTVFKELPSKE